MRLLGKWVRCLWHNNWANFVSCTSLWFDASLASRDGGPEPYKSVTQETKVCVVFRWYNNLTNTMSCML